MRGMNTLIVWLGVASFAAVGFLLLFYTAAVLLPILLGLFVFSIIASWLKNLKYSNKRAEKVKVFYRNGEVSRETEAPKQPNIIDAEYEIVDDKDKR